MYDSRAPYDKSAAMWSPDGELVQLSYARKASERGAAAVGMIIDKKTILLAGETLFDPLVVRRDKLQEIDLTAAAISNAEGIERAVNRGTENAGRCFELLSGAELNDKERNAENGIAFNKECPWLYDDYKSRGLLDETTAD